jgi:hypothetical protein
MAIPMMLNNHPDIIRVFALLAQGDRQEARRWLQTFLKNYPQYVNNNDPLILWLDAQTRATREERLQQLRLLTAMSDPQNEYYLLARHLLSIEEQENPTNTRRFIPIAIGLTVLIVLIGLAGVLLTPASTLPVTPTAIAVQATLSLTPTSSPTPLPILVTALAIPPRITYEAGQLQITAIEDLSLRVVSRSTRQLVQPIQGARFYVLYVTFECLVGVCQDPPEADLTLIQVDGFTFEPREDVIPLDTPALEAVALGIPTSGAIVFEIPFVGMPTVLRILPEGAEQPIDLRLP